MDPRRQPVPVENDVIGPQKTPCQNEAGSIALCCPVPVVSTVTTLPFLTCDGNDVEEPPHGLWADVTEPVFAHQQLGEVKGHLSGDGPLHLPAPISVLNRGQTDHIITGLVV